MWLPTAVVFWAGAAGVTAAGAAAVRGGTMTTCPGCSTSSSEMWFRSARTQMLVPASCAIVQSDSPDATVWAVGCAAGAAWTAVDGGSGFSAGAADGEALSPAGAGEAFALITSPEAEI